MIFYPVSSSSDILDRKAAGIGGKPARISSDVIKRLRDTSEESTGLGTVTDIRRHGRNQELPTYWGSKTGQENLSQNQRGGRSKEWRPSGGSRAEDNIFADGVAGKKDGAAGTISRQNYQENIGNVLLSSVGVQNKTWIRNIKEETDTWKYSIVDSILDDLTGKVETLQELDKTLGNLIGGREGCRSLDGTVNDNFFHDS